ncbi:MAG: hypothetical protein HRU19_00090 [Pseudobacteriovorax sp.]|nr:hypothetical protein [Pseudobacteriovorax sp.]
MRFFKSLVLVLMFIPVRLYSQDAMIYQAFNERFVDIIGQLEQLKDWGVSHVLISPPQKSLDRSEWWARYQPVDYRFIDGPLGNESELVELIEAANNYEIAIVADTVLNHMADIGEFPDLRFPQFGPQDFHFAEQRPCIFDYSDRFQATNYWLCDFRADLPDLNTSSDYVRSIHLTYLKKLIDLGIRGFRWDAAVNIEVDYFRWLLPQLGEDIFQFGEVVGTSLEEVQLYTDIMKSTDFRLLIQMTRHISSQGDIQNLKPSILSDALNPDKRISFVRNHDADFNPGFFNFQSIQHAALGYIYVLGGVGGVPFLYNRDMTIPEVLVSLEFRKRTRQAESNFESLELFCQNCSRDILTWSRGNDAFVILNKSDNWHEFDFRAKDLQAGCYEELRYEFEVCLAQDFDGSVRLNSWAGGSRASIGSMTGLLFVRK